MGDILHIFPALQILREQCPEAELDFMINPEFAPLLDFSPFPVTEKILFERKKMAAWSTAAGEFIKLVRRLRRKKYDLVIDFQGLFRSAFFAGISSHRSKAVYGFDSPRERISRFFYSRRAVVSQPHAVEKNVELVNFIFSADHAVPTPYVPIDRDLLNNLPSFPRPYILLLPGARWESKCFPATLFAQTALAVNRCKKDIHFVAAGSKAEIRRSAELCAALPSDFPITDLTGKTTLNELFALISQADAVICNDSGPMHIAALLEKPVFAFFGPTDPEKTGPWKQRARVFTAGCDCALCMNKKCPRPEMVCHNIDPDAVAQFLFQQLYKESLS